MCVCVYVCKTQPFCCTPETNTCKLSLIQCFQHGFKKKKKEMSSVVVTQLSLSVVYIHLFVLCPQRSWRVSHHLPSYNSLPDIKGWVPYGLPWWLRWQSICLQCGRPRFNPRVGKIPWRRKWQSTSEFLPGKSHRQRSLVGYSPWGCRVRHDWGTDTHPTAPPFSFLQHSDSLTACLIF